MKARIANLAQREREYQAAVATNARVKELIPDWEQQLAAREEAFQRDVRLGLILLNKTPRC